MRRNAVSVLKFALLCLVFVTTPFMISWTLNFFFPIEDYPVDYMHARDEAVSVDRDILYSEGSPAIEPEVYVDHDDTEDLFDPRIYMIDKKGEFDPRIYMIDKKEPVYNPLSQDQVDYIAKNIKIQYDILNNFAKYAFFSARLSLLNNGSVPISGGNWSIYLFHFSFIEPKYIKNNKSALVCENQFNITHVDGSLYTMSPTSAFVDILPGETREIILTNGNSMVARSDAFPNWYISAPQTIPRIIANTNDETLAFIGDFQSIEKWKRTSSDLFDPYTPEKRYFINADAHDFGQAKKLVIPTPLNLTRVEKVLDLNVDKWSIVFSDDLVMEAHILSGQLDLPVAEDLPSTHFIHIRIGFVNLPVSTSTHLVRDEAYRIQMDADKNTVIVTGSTSAGVFYAIQTLSSVYSHNTRQLQCIEVIDAPRFPYRGLMLDVARNFFPVYEVIKILDTMGMYKMNVLHLHLSDDQGWRLEIPGLEELTRVGSRRGANFTQGVCLAPTLGSGPFTNNSGSGFYTTQEYRIILRHAKSRHIKIIPEFDMPGHANAAMVSMEARYRRLSLTNMEEATRYRLTDPEDVSEYIAPEGHRHTTINPCMESTYAFVEKLMATVKSLHQNIEPLETFHMGGDEVPSEALRNSPICGRFTLEHPYYNTSARLREYFVRRVVEIGAKMSLKVQAWEDGMLDDLKMPFDLTQFPVPNVTVNLWNNVWERGRGHRTALFANRGYKVILSHATHLYFDHPQEPDPEERGLYWARRFIDTRKVFSFQPDHIYDNMDEEILGRQIIKSEACTPGGMVDCIPLEKPENIIGMQGHLWTETIRNTDQLEEMLYPRLLALAERSWHRASWEGVLDDHVRERLRLEDWESFANSLGHKELSRLEGLKISYYLPPPGALFTDNEMQVNTLFPGMVVQYSLDGGVNWSDTLPNMKLDHSTILLATRSFNLVRRGRKIPVEVPW